MKTVLVFLMFVLFGAWLLLVVPATPATRLVIDDVEVIGSAEGADDCALVTVRFSFPVRYKRHFPYGSGNDLRVQLSSIVSSAEEAEAMLTRETIVPASGEAALLTEIDFEGNIQGGPYLSLFFSRPVKFDVRQGADFRSIEFAVSEEGEPDCLPERP